MDGVWAYFSIVSKYHGKVNHCYFIASSLHDPEIIMCYINLAERETCIGRTREKERERGKKRKTAVRTDFDLRGDDGNCEVLWRRLAKRRTILDTPGGAWRPRFTCEKHFRPNEKRPTGPYTIDSTWITSGNARQIRRTSVFHGFALALNYSLS